MSPTFRSFAIATLLVAVSHPVLAADLKIACVGNSITAGMGVASNLNYPTKLGGILGTGYAVTNYGNSGKTMLREVNDAYWKQPEFAKVFADKPDIIVIELGTNDSKDYIWPYNKQNFKRDYKAMIDTFRTISSKPSIWITLQPRANNVSWGMPDTTIARQVNPLIREVAFEKATGLIDLRTGFDGHPDWYQSDSVHPNATGANGMATIIGERLKHDRPEIAARGTNGPAVETSADGWGVRWYRNDSLLDGETGQDLKSTLPGVYKASVKVYQNSDDWIVTAPFTWTGPTSVAARVANGLRVRIDAAGRVQAHDAGGAVVDGIRLRDARGVEVPSGPVRSGVYAWSFGCARGHIAVP